jgi:hypothetical protein
LAAQPRHTFGSSYGAGIAGIESNSIQKEQAERYGAEMTLPEWHARLVCSKCGSHEIDMVVTSSRQ